MYTDLALYYLNHMGIRPWIFKKDSLSTQSAGLVLIVEPLKQGLKAKSLLKNIMDFIKLLEFEPVVLPRITSSTLNKSTPKAILTFGLPVSADPPPNCPIFSYDLEELLTQPTKKKNIFNELLGCVDNCSITQATP